MIYKNIISPLLDRFVDPELGHDLTHDLFHYLENSTLGLNTLNLLNANFNRFDNKKLQTNLGGIKLDNPLMVAAGWDKTGSAAKALWQLGFGAVEIGSVPIYSQYGNPKPRLYRLGNGVYLNRMGFNSPGVEVVDANLTRYKDAKIPIGVNVGINKHVTPDEAPQAYAFVVKKLSPHASYFVINVSSPNTPGLRKLQGKKFLVEIVKTVRKTLIDTGSMKPLYIKIAPDLTKGAILDLLEVALNQKVTGIIATNTSNQPHLKAKYGMHWQNQTGGISGDDEHYRLKATQIIAYIFSQVGGKLEIIGVGGIKDTQTALEKITAGAKAVQLLSALRSEGPAVAGNINRGLINWMEKNKVKRLSDIVGIEAKKYSKLKN